MSDSTTIARPYAKAIFEHALNEKQLAQWSEHLLVLTHSVLSGEGFEFITNPATTEQQHVAFLESVCSSKGKDDTALSQFITLLATNKRLLVIPEIKTLYESHRAEQEKTLEVEVTSFSTVSEEQQKQMIEALSLRVQRTVSLKINIDPSLLGGAIIQAGDLVIDGSIRGKLNTLATDLAA